MLNVKIFESKSLYTSKDYIYREILWRLDGAALFYRLDGASLFSKSEKSKTYNSFYYYKNSFSPTSLEDIRKNNIFNVAKNDII